MLKCVKLVQKQVGMNNIDGDTKNITIIPFQVLDWSFKRCNGGGALSGSNSILNIRTVTLKGQGEGTIFNFTGPFLDHLS